MRITKETDSVLIQQFIEGDHKGVEQLFSRHQDRLYTYIFFLVKKQEVAEDIFQDTFVKAFNSLQKGKYKDNGRFFSWISRIAHNLVIDHFRLQKKLKTVSDEDQDEKIYVDIKSMNVEDSIANKQILSDVRNLLEYLPDDQREVVVMRNYLDMSFKEIAEITNVSINTSLGRMRYAIINLKKLVKEHKIALDF
jgi:RNA polymerase sigma-70 factor (ECF subfamily)